MRHCLTDVAIILSRIWDVMFRDGQEFLFRAALGILSMYQVKPMIHTYMGYMVIGVEGLR
jgi:hypothetical protein